MKQKILAIAGIILLAAAGVGGGYWFAMHRMMAEMDAQASAPAPAGKTVLYWHDPMYPQHKFDKPGKSPFMDMMLVPVYGDGGPDNSSVKISPRVVQNLGVRTADVVKGTLARKVEAVGSVVFDERAVAVVQARSAGYLEKLYVRAPLDPVTKAQPLAQIFVPEWAGAQEEFLALKRSESGSAAEFTQAARNRLLLMGMSEELVRAVERSGKAVSRITLTAPIGGVVGELLLREGMSVMPGVTLMRINGLDKVWVYAEVAEMQAGGLKPGATADVTVPAYPGERFMGTLAAILPEVNPTTRTLKTRIELANPDGRLKPGMFASVRFASLDNKEMLLIPSEAVIQTGERSVVMLALGEGKFQPVDIETGIVVNDQTEIRSGLKAGQKVVISSQFLLDSEASLKATGNRLMAQPEMNDSAATGAKAQPMRGDK